MKFFDEFYVKSPAEMRELRPTFRKPATIRLEIAAHDLTIPEKVFISDYPVPKTVAEDIAGVLAGALVTDGATRRPSAVEMGPMSTCGHSASAG